MKKSRITNLYIYIAVKATPITIRKPKYMDMNDVKLMEKQIDEMLDGQKARQTYANGRWTMFRLAIKSCLKKDIVLAYTQICQDVLALHHRNSVWQNDQKARVSEKYNLVKEFVETHVEQLIGTNQILCSEKGCTMWLGKAFA